MAQTRAPAWGVRTIIEQPQVTGGRCVCERYVLELFARHVYDGIPNFTRIVFSQRRPQKMALNHTIEGPVIIVMSSREFFNSAQHIAQRVPNVARSAHTARWPIGQCDMMVMLGFIPYRWVLILAVTNALCVKFAEPENH
eukprot:9438603-Karenia_brevis.AAC.1